MTRIPDDTIEGEITYSCGFCQSIGNPIPHSRTCILHPTANK